MASAVKKVLITYQSREKILTIPQENGISSLRLEFCVVFGVSEAGNSVTFQRYDSEFEENVDVESDDEVLDREKLQAVVTACDVSLDYCCVVILLS